MQNTKEIDVEKIFERFYKADAARSQTSSGLGLSIAKELVEKMQGKIGVEIIDEKFCIEIIF